MRRKRALPKRATLPPIAGHSARILRTTTHLEPDDTANGWGHEWRRANCDVRQKHHSASREVLTHTCQAGWCCSMASVGRFWAQKGTEKIWHFLRKIFNPHYVMHSAWHNFDDWKSRILICIRSLRNDFQYQDLGPICHSQTSLNVGIMVPENTFECNEKYDSHGTKTDFEIMPRESPIITSRKPTPSNGKSTASWKLAPVPWGFCREDIPIRAEKKSVPEEQSSNFLAAKSKGAGEEYDGDFRRAILPPG